MNTITINGAPRTAIGKTATKADRNEKRIPCVVYGAGAENVHFTTILADVRDLIFTPDFKLAQVNVEGNSFRCIVKEVQYHPVREDISHIDFLQLSPGGKVTVDVPVRFQGVSPGVREGGKFDLKLRKVKIKTTTEKLINEVLVDISNLGLGQTLRVKDIQPAEGVEIINPGALPIAIVTVPRGLKEAAATTEATAKKK